MKNTIKFAITLYFSLGLNNPPQSCVEYEKVLTFMPTDNFFPQMYIISDNCDMLYTPQLALISRMFESFVNCNVVVVVKNSNLTAIEY